jgi:hypothetical protein
MGKVAVITNWDEYEVYHPGVFGPLNTLPRSQAHRAFISLMEAKSERIEMLRRLLRAAGFELSNTDSAIQDLNDWFRANVEADPGKPGRLLAEWYSVVNDVALFLGDVIIERCPRLHWEFFVWGKKNVSYQRPVIMGFSKVANPKYNMDIDMVVAAYAHRIVASRGSIPSYGRVMVRGVEIDIDSAVAGIRRPEVEADAFLRLVKVAESQA